MLANAGEQHRDDPERDQSEDECSDDSTETPRLQRCIGPVWLRDALYVCLLSSCLISRVLQRRDRTCELLVGNLALQFEPLVLGSGGRQRSAAAGNLIELCVDIPCKSC